MSESWIRVIAHLSRRRVAKRLARICGGDAQKAAGVLVDFWSSVSEYGSNGYIRDEDDSTLEDWAVWRGKRGAFAAWVRAHHMDADGRVPEWDDFMGRLELRRAKDRERKRQAYVPTSARSPTEPPAENPPENPPENVRNLGGSSVPAHANGTERYGTVRSTPTIPDPATPRPPGRRSRHATATATPAEPAAHWVRDAAELWRAKVGVVTEGHLGGVLKPLVDAHGWPVVRAALDVYVSPDEGPVARGKNLKPQWFAEEFQHWRLIAEEPLEVGGIPTARAKRLLGGAA